MSTFPAVTGAQLIKALRKLGFEVIRVWDIVCRGGPQPMTKNDFRIDLEFYTASGKWRCTDVGARVIVAIKLDQDNPSWYAGPPYAVAESVFDEFDMGGCSLDPEDFPV